MGRARDGYRLGYPAAGSNIDTDVTIRDVGDLLTYLPRAALVAFFAPFPEMWCARGSQAYSTVMRGLAGLEMSITYLSFVGLAYGLWRWRRRVEVYVILVFCTGMMVAQVLIVTNVGALHRLRYAFLTTVAGLGLAAGLSACQGFRSHSKQLAASPSDKGG